MIRSDSLSHHGVEDAEENIIRVEYLRDVELFLTPILPRAIGH